MTAPPGTRCAACGAAGGLYSRGGDNFFCRDTAGCRQRMAGVGDPVAEVTDIAVPAARPAAVPGARCSVCGVTDPPGGAYFRGAAAYVCLDRAGCEQRAVEYQFLHAWGDSSPDRLISSADMRAAVSSAGAQIPPERADLDPVEMAARAAQEAAGRKQQP